MKNLPVEKVIFMRFCMSQDKLIFFAERYGPYIVGLLFSIIGYIFCIKYNLSIDDLEKIFNLVITMTTVILGFIGVLLGIIATIKEKPEIKRFWEIDDGDARKTLKSYFMKSLHVGIFLIFYSIGLLVLIKVKCLEQNFLRVLQVFWCCICGYSLGCSYRVINFVMLVLFSENSEIKEQGMINKVDKERERQLREKYSK